MITHFGITGIVPDFWCKWALSHTAYLQLIGFVPSDGVISHFGSVFSRDGSAGAGFAAPPQQKPAPTVAAQGGFLTGTGRDVALLVFLRRARARLTPVLGLRVAAGSLPAADAPAAVPAALRPGGPGRPAAVHGVPGDPPQAENVTCGG